MAQRVKSVHDVGASQGLLINNPAEDEARAKEASSRADQALRAQLAAQAVAMSNPSRTVSGSPNGGGSETAAMGHAISNPWLREEREKGKSQEAVRFQQGRADQQNAFNSQQDLQRQGLAQQFAAMQQDAMLRQFENAQRGQLAREGMGLQREGMQAEGDRFNQNLAFQREGRTSEDSRFNRTMDQQNDFFTRNQESEDSRFDKSFAQRGDQFDANWRLERDKLDAMERAQNLEALTAREAEGRRLQAAATQRRAEAGGLLQQNGMWDDIRNGRATAETLKAIEDQLMLRPDLMGGVADSVQDPRLDAATHTEWDYSLDHPINSAQLAFRDFFAKANALGWFGLVDSSGQKQRSAQDVLARLRALQSPGAPRDSVGDMFHNRIMRQ